MVDSLQNIMDNRSDKLKNLLREDRDNAEAKADEYKLKDFTNNIYMDPNFSRRAGNTNTSYDGKGNKSNLMESKIEVDPEKEVLIYF
jgi:membrane protein involved in colicin uptake